MVQLSDATSAAAARLRAALTELRESTPAASGESLRRLTTAAGDLAHAAALDVVSARLAGDAASRRTAGELLDRLASTDRVARDSLLAALVAIAPATALGSPSPPSPPSAPSTPRTAPSARRITPPPWFPRGVASTTQVASRTPSAPAPGAPAPGAPAPGAPAPGAPAPGAPTYSRASGSTSGSARRPPTPTFLPAEAPIRLPTWGGWTWSAMSALYTPDVNPAKRRSSDADGSPRAKRR